MVDDKLECTWRASNHDQIPHKDREKEHLWW